MKFRRLDYLLILIFLSSFYFVHDNVVSTDRFGYDESDYMYAAEKGFLANYWDLNAIPFFEFIKKGREEGKQSENRTSLSQFIRDSDAITFYRHYHGPIYFYWLSFFNFQETDKEYYMRWVSLSCVFLALIIIYFGSNSTLNVISISPLKTTTLTVSPGT